VLKDDAASGEWSDIYQVPPSLIDRLRHYFLTYKEIPGESRGAVEIAEVYGRRAAQDVINRSREDYYERFSELHEVRGGMPGEDEAPFISRVACRSLSTPWRRTAPISTSTDDY
jgi:inorganic pyrophosphatase